MPVVELLGTAFLASAVLVYVVVIAMCRAAGRADHAGARLDDAGEVIVDLDGAARGVTPSAGVRVPPIPTPRSGVPIAPRSQADPRSPRREP